VELRDRLQSSLGTTYTLERELGGGGMSRVFVAEEARLGRKVVVKVLPPELAADISIERFEREIKLAASLQQANIVPVLSAGDTGGVPYYTMPFVEGEGLRARLRNRRAMSISEVVSVLRDVARALAYAHERGIVHRDIKPDNVLLSGGAAVVTDFGIAKAISASRTHSDSATLTHLGNAIGTPAYIAPEQAAGDPDVDHRADIYSFGCMAYEMLTGQPPFANRAPQRLMAAHIGEKPQQILELRSDTPPALAAMVMRCLEKDASARQQTATELFAALDASTTSDAGHLALPEILLGGRRMLRKALVVYGGAFIAVAVLAKAAIVGIGLPDWVFPGALIVMALGLPVILFTAYTQYVARRALTTSLSFTPGGKPSTATHGTVAAIAIKASPHVSWRRVTFGGLYAIGAFITLIGAFMLMRALGIGPAGSLLGAGKFTTREPVLIADFAVTGTPDSGLGPVASDAVRAALSESSIISLVSPERVASALRRMERAPTSRLDLALARELAQREGIKAVVDGNVTGVSGGYILTLRLVTADSATELASFRETGDGPRGLIEAADRLARRLRSKIGESLRTVQASVPLAQATTGSLDALRKYSAAARAISIEGRYAKGAALARDAVAIDSTFASAWSQLAQAMFNASMPQAPQDSALERAFRNSSRLPERERLGVIARYYMQGPHRDRGKAVAAYEKLLRTDDRASGNTLALLYSYRGQSARAESLFTRDIGNDSFFLLPYTNAVDARLNQGKVRQAEAMLRIAQRRFPASPQVLRRDVYLRYAEGNLGEVERDVETLKSSPDPAARAYGVQFKAALASLEGRYAESTHWDREAGGVLAAQGASGIAVADSLKVLEADAWFHGSSDRVARAIDATLTALPLRDVAPADRPYFLAARVYALAGRPDKSRLVLEQYQREITDTALVRLGGPQLHLALAEIALAEHNTTVARAEFRLGDINPSDGFHESLCGTVCLSFNLARAFDLAEKPDSAIAMYERYLNTPSAWRLWLIDQLALAGTYKRLGELYEAKGERQKAASHYVRFIELWKNADAEFQPQVAEVRRRLVRLADSEKR
jgi:eukaryotic-like serine/threonine-protein kinase